LTFDLSGSYIVGNGGTEIPYDEQVAILQCQGCNQNVIVIEEKYVGGRRQRDGGNAGTIQWRGIHWWPMPGMQPGDPDVPAPVAEAIAEGTRCLAARSPRAAAAMFRAALGEVVTDRGSDDARGKRTLAAQLAQMATDGALDSTLADWASHIRAIGNAGAHPNELDPVSLAEAQDLARLTDALIDYLYVYPARVRRAREDRSG